MAKKLEFNDLVDVTSFNAGWADLLGTMKSQFDSVISKGAKVVTIQPQDYQGIKEYTKAIDDSTKAAAANEKITQALAEYQKKLTTAMSDGSHSVTGYRASIRVLNQELEKAFGANDQARIQAYTKQIGKLKVEQKEFADMMKYMQGRNFLEGTVKTMRGVAGGFAAADAAMKLFGSDNEQLNEVMKKSMLLLQLMKGLEEVTALTREQGMLKGLALQIKELFVKTTYIGALEAETVATGEATAAQDGLNVAMEANPVGIVVAAIVGLITVLGILAYEHHKETAAQKEAREEMELSVQVRESAADSSAKEILSLREMTDAIHNEALSRNERAKKVQELMDKYPEYLGQMDKEKLLAGDIADVYNRTSTALVNKAIVAAYEDTITKSIKAQTIAQLELEAATIKENKAIDELNKKYQSSSGLVSDENALKKIGSHQNVIANAQEKYNKALAKTNKLMKLLGDVQNQLDVVSFLYGDKDVKKREEQEKKDAQRLKELRKKQQEEIDKEMEELSKDISEKQIEFLKELHKNQQEQIDKDMEALSKDIEERAKYLKERQKFWLDTIIQAQDEVDQERKDKLKREEEQREKEIAVIDDFLKTEQEKKQRAYDKDIDNSKRHQDMLHEIAARGSEDAKDNLAYEEANQRKLEQQKENAIQRAKQTELALAVLKSYSKNIEASDGDTSKALAQTMKDTVLLEMFVKALPAFYEGTENLEGGNLDDKGGKLIIAHKGEGILNPSMNKMKIDAGLSNWEMLNSALLYKKGTELNQPWQTNEQILNKFDRLEQAINNKPTLIGVDYDKLIDHVITTIKQGNSIKTTHKKVSYLE